MINQKLVPDFVQVVSCDSGSNLRQDRVEGPCRKLGGLPDAVDSLLVIAISTGVGRGRNLPHVFWACN